MASTFEGEINSAIKLCYRVIGPGVGDRKSPVWWQQRERGWVWYRWASAAELGGRVQESSLCVLATVRHWPVFRHHYTIELAFQVLCCPFIYTNMPNNIDAFFLWCHFLLHNAKCIFIYHICLYINIQTHAHMHKHMCTLLLSSPWCSVYIK